MTPGFYVVRRPRDALILESRQFHTKEQALNWSDWIMECHPRDKVYVMEIHHEVHT